MRLFGTGLSKVDGFKAPGVKEFAHRDGSRDESHGHRWRRFAPQAPVRSDPVMDESLHIEGALQRRLGFGIEVLASPISAAPSP